MISYNRFISQHKYIHSFVVPALKDAGYIELSDRINSCGTIIRVATCSDCGSKHFAGNASRCLSRFCPSCSRLRSNAWCARLLPFLDQWFNQGKYACEINFTIADTVSLSEGLRVLKSAFRYMTHDDKFSRNAFKKMFVGGIRSIEIKTGKYSGSWHPHIHCIVLKDKYTRDFDLVRQLWERAVKAVGGVPGKGLKYGSVYAHGFTRKGMLKNVIEVVKYITKIDWMNESPARVRELIDNSKNLRNVQCWGVLCRLPKKVEDDVKNADERALKGKICHACHCTELTLEKTWYDVERELYDLVDISTVSDSTVHSAPVPYTPVEGVQLHIPLTRYGSLLEVEDDVKEMVDRMV